VFLLKLKNTLIGVSFIVISFFLSDCVSLSTLNTVQTINKGTMCGNIGLGPLPEIGGRYGLSSRSDFGMKVAFPGTIFMDFKTEVTRSPFITSMDLGYSVFTWTGTDDNRYFIHALYPMIMIGRENWYLGVKKILLNPYELTIREDIEQHGFRNTSDPIISTGYVFNVAQGVRILTEVNILTGEELKESAILPGLGFEFELK